MYKRQDFRFAGEAFDEAPAGLVRELLSQPLHALVYMAGVTALGFHLAHAFRSACQSLGVNHPKLTPLLETASLVIAVGLWLGFISFPIYLWITGGGSN